MVSFRCVMQLSAFFVCAQAFGGGGTPITMTETSLQCGVNARYTAPAGNVFINVLIAGAAAEDFNRDGLIDLYVLGGAQQRDWLYINLGPDAEGVVQYEDQSEAWGILSPQVGAGVSVADYDNNGYLDLYITAQGNELGTRPGQHRLYRNMGPDENGQFHFEEVADQAGVAVTSVNHSDGFSSSWGDIDRDGDLDLLVGGWIGNSGGNILFRNNSDGTFTDITAAAMDIDMIVATHGLTPRIVDVTGDGAPEILIAADYRTSKLLLNDGTGHFTNITESANVNHDSNGMGGVTADVNNDGRVDWYVSSIKNGTLSSQDGNKLYMNLGNGVFEETAVSAGVDDGGWGWGTAAGDLDNDGDVDLAETNGWPGGQWINEQSYIYINEGDGTSFTEQALALGVDNHGLGRGAIMFDHDNDGDLDVAFVSQDIRLHIYRNDAALENTNHWVQMRLNTMSSPSNAPDGVGAHVVIRTGKVVQHRWVQANSGYLSQGPIMVHAGLADATVIDRVEIHWPNGAVRVIENLAVDAQYTFTPCDADMNGNHLIEKSDVALFILGFQTAQRSTDLDANGTHNIFDILAFLDSYNAGCPQDR